MVKYFIPVSTVPLNSGISYQHVVVVSSGDPWRSHLAVHVYANYCTG